MDDLEHVIVFKTIQMFKISDFSYQLFTCYFWNDRPQTIIIPQV